MFARVYAHYAGKDTVQKGREELAGAFAESLKATKSVAALYLLTSLNNPLNLTTAAFWKSKESWQKWADTRSTKQSASSASKIWSKVEGDNYDASQEIEPTSLKAGASVFAVIDFHKANSGMVEKAKGRIEAFHAALRQVQGVLCSYTLISQNDPLKIDDLVIWKDQASYEKWFKSRYPTGVSLPPEVAKIWASITAEKFVGVRLV